MKLNWFFALLLLFYSVPLISYADGYEISIRQVNPEGFVHKKTCETKGNFCTQEFAIPVSFRDMAAVIDAGVIIDLSEDRVTAAFKVDQHYLKVANKAAEHFSEPLDKGNLGPEVLKLYAALTKRGWEKTPNAAVARGWNMPVADLEITIRKKSE